MNGSLERMDPDKAPAAETAGYETLLLHLERYNYAAQFLKQGDCADIACGTGYGSYLLASRYPNLVARIIAVDIDGPSIEYARSRYAHPLIQFIKADALDFQFPGSLQNVISLETIEHLSDPQTFVQNVSRQLKPGCRFIASVPITPSMDANPYHLHDFTKNTFLKLFRDAGYQLIDSFEQNQPYQLFSVLSRKEERSKELRKGLLHYYLQHPSKLLLRIRSLLVDGFRNKYLVAVFEKL